MVVDLSIAGIILFSSVVSFMILHYMLFFFFYCSGSCHYI